MILNCQCFAYSSCSPILYHCLYSCIHRNIYKSCNKNNDNLIYTVSFSTKILFFLTVLIFSSLCPFCLHFGVFIRIKWFLVGSWSIVAPILSQPIFFKLNFHQCWYFDRSGYSDYCAIWPYRVLHPVAVKNVHLQFLSILISFCNSCKLSCGS